MEFGEGLNVLSGETGSGKSIIVQAMELLLGARGSSDLIRQGEEESEVVGLFSSRGTEELSLRRVISRSGKNRAYLNERPVPVSVLESTGQELVDLVNQHEHQVLLNPEQHLSLLDQFALDQFNDFGAAIGEYQKTYHRYQELQAERDRLLVRRQETQEKEEFLRFQLKELVEAQIQPNEDEKLQREKDVSKNAVRLTEVCEHGDELLESGESSVSGSLVRLQKEIHQASLIDRDFLGIEEILESAICQLQEVAKKLRQYGQKISSDPERLQEIEDRLALIAKLKKKYGGALGVSGAGGSVESMIQKQQSLEQELGLLDHSEEKLTQIDKELSELSDFLLKFSKDLSQRRKKSSQKLSKQVEEGLQNLGMAAARFSFALKPLSKGPIEIQKLFFNEHGSDDAEMMMAPNPGEGLHPLAKIASGGEISRVFLAIKSVLGSKQAFETCVFDEVDSGIGGRVAEVIGRNLSEMSEQRQVLCITHLPQIACYADQHFVIQKHVEKGRTSTLIQRLQNRQREEEIARMLAGIKITDQAIAHAREMLKSAGNA